MLRAPRKFSPVSEEKNKNGNDIMGKYFLKRLLHGLLSIIIVVAVVMVLIYSMLDRALVFSGDPVFSHQKNNSREAYQYSKWEEYGYLDYVTYADYVNELARNGEIDEETRAEAVKFGRKPKNDSDITKEYAAKFTSTTRARAIP